MAVPVPPDAVAVMVTVPDAVIVDGAVKKPVEVMEPAEALHEVALGAENCCVPPSRMVAVGGETGNGVARVTVALLVPPGPVALIVSVPVAVAVVGAVYKPEEVMVPASALQLVTLLAENCNVAPRPKVAVAGEITGAGVVLVAPTGTVSELLCQVPGLFTKQVAVPLPGPM